MIRVLSPHLDDACLSLGQWLSTEPGDVEVVTVLAGVPDRCEQYVSDYDRACGFVSSIAAMRTRQFEDVDALSFYLDHAVRHLSFLDCQYLDGPRSDSEAVIVAIKNRYSPEELMFAPLGIGHPDHLFVADCAREAVRRSVGPEPVGLILYEELPGRVLHPEEVHERLRVVAAEGWEIGALPWPLPQGDRSDRLRKAVAISRYRSQFPEGADDPALLVPERCWQCTLPAQDA